MKTIAIIPARGGSTGVPKKNLAPIGGYPLLAYSIVAAKACPEIDRVILSTDSEEIAATARSFGADAPFLRPAEFSQDGSPDIDYIRHALEWLAKASGSADLIALVRPTTPLRDPARMGEAIRALKQDQNATSVRSVHTLAEPPQKMMQIVDGYLRGFFPNDPRPEYFNLPRQAFPAAYHPNGYIDIVRTRYLLETQTLYGPRILAYVTPVTQEIDQMEDIEQLQWFVDRKGHPLQARLTKDFPAHPKQMAAGKGA